MEGRRIYLSTGANELNLPSGDKGLYIDICIEELKKIIDNHDKNVLRPWFNRDENEMYNNIRIFAKPGNKNDFYGYYLEIAKPEKKVKKGS